MAERTGLAIDLGPAPIVDFDGTIAALPVDWPALRQELRVRRIDDLWLDATATGDPEGAWSRVTQAESEAAALATPIEPVARALALATGFAVLTSNSGLAVMRFLEGHPHLRARLVTVVGREGLGGPKSDFHRFRDGFGRCRAATSSLRGGGDVVYVGDREYELDFARRLGALSVDVADLLA
jgi:phosphoglycolate phosphatase-like HAD superfamily hydrolase